MICDTLFVTVSYNNTKATETYVKSWLNLLNCKDNFLIVVDNSTNADDELRDNLTGYNNIIYIRQAENKGYMAGCNYGLHFAKVELGIVCNSIVYSNNDITFETSTIILKINERFNNDPELAVIAPSIWDVNEKKELNPFMVSRPKNKRFKLMKLIYKYYFFAKIVDFISRNRPRRKKLIHRVSTSIYAAHGSVFILRGDIFLNDVPDDAYFLYGEEITIAERCLSLNKKIELDKDLLIFHHSHSTTGAKLSHFTYQAKKNAINYLTSKYTWF